MAGPAGEACSIREACPRGRSPSTGSCNDSSDGGRASGAALSEPQLPKYFAANCSTCQTQIPHGCLTTRADFSPAQRHMFGACHDCFLKIQARD